VYVARRAEVNRPETRCGAEGNIAELLEKDPQVTAAVDRDPAWI
jgi:hypothetical protein